MMEKTLSRARTVAMNFCAEVNGERQSFQRKTAHCSPSMAAPQSTAKFNEKWWMRGPQQRRTNQELEVQVDAEAVLAEVRRRGGPEQVVPAGVRATDRVRHMR
jgi:hypothetical protein